MTLHDSIDGVHEHVGYLTWDEFDRFRAAVNNSRTVILWLQIAGYIRSAEADIRVHTTRDGHIGIPPTSIAAIELTRLLQELNYWHELEDAANDELGAWLARTFTKELETADARWPHKPRSHRVTHMRCQACDALTLRWMPPRHEGDTAVVKCTDKTCAAVMDETMFAFAAELIRREQEEADARRRVDKSRRSRNADRTLEAHDLSVDT